jgi:hypothetical protein
MQLSRHTYPEWTSQGLRKQRMTQSGETRKKKQKKKKKKKKKDGKKRGLKALRGPP